VGNNIFVVLNLDEISEMNPNAGTRAAEETKTKKYKHLCEQRGMDFERTDCLHSEWRDGRAVPAAILESTLD
jgi:hypothetical protein